MKFVHTSDWHLGRVIFGRSLLEDQKFFLEHCLYPIIEEEKPDAIIVAGDIFDRQIAPVEAIRLFDSAINTICDRYSVPLIIISGNHDSADRLSLGSGLLRRSGLLISAYADTFAPPVVLKGERDVHIYSLPYINPAEARDILKDDSIKSFSDAYSALLSHINESLDKNAVNIIVSHCFVAGSVKSGSESPIFAGNSGSVGTELFQDFDYVALGHLHRAQNIGGNMRYSGSPLKYSFDEENHQKSVTVIETGASVSIREIPIKPLRDMRTVTGTLDEIEAAAKTDHCRDDFVFANLIGPPCFEPMKRLREFYPNALGLSRTEKVAGRDSDRDLLRSYLKRNDLDTIFCEFLRQVCGKEPDDSDISIFSSAKDEVLKKG